MANLRWSRHSQAGLEFDERYDAALEHNYEDPISYKDSRPLSTSQNDHSRTLDEDKFTVVESHSSSKSSWLILTLAIVVTALVIGGAIGGGLGSALNECHLQR